MDERGFAEVLSMELVHGVTSAPSVWHKARVRIKGSEIRLWVEGRPLRPVYDDTHRTPGCVGLATVINWGTPEMRSFRNAAVRGATAPAPAFNPGLQPAVNYRLIKSLAGTGSGSIARAANGEVAVISANLPWRSADNGRTWKKGPAVPEGVGEGLLRTAPDGTLESYFATHVPPFVLKKAISRDSGKTWETPRVVSEISFPQDAPFTVFYPGHLLETRSGALLFSTAASYGRLTS